MAVGSAVAILLVALFALAALATDAQMYFASDRNGQNRKATIQEGDEIWIVVYDPDGNIDCDLRDKMWVDLKVFDPKTGAYIIWDNGGYIGREETPAHLAHDYLEETGADTGLFVSHRPFQVGTRENYVTDRLNTHVVDENNTDFRWGHYSYDGDNNWAVDNIDGDQRGWFGPRPNWTFTAGLMPSTMAPVLPSVSGSETSQYLVGRFENMDTLVGMYQDYNDASDVAVTMAKIIDTEARISWDQEVYKDPRGAARITVVDPDENLNCNVVEYVPVFIIVNPGSWNVQTGSRVNTFCQLLRTGGIDPNGGGLVNKQIRWYNIYDSGLADPYPANHQEHLQGGYYFDYPRAGEGNVTSFDTEDTNGYCRVLFYAQETGVNTGVFELDLNNILTDLGFVMLNVRDVLVAFYLDPNDFDDFKLATAYIEEHQHSLTNFTDASRNGKRLFWIGRDPVYVQVIDQNANVDPCCPEQVVVHICDPHEEDDSEWVILDETSSNSPVFFTNAGMQLLPVWDALGIGLAQSLGGYQLQLDNWKLEVFNEDSIYAQYNDVYYELDTTGMLGLGDTHAVSTANTAFPPAIDRVRVANDVSFDLMEIADTQVFDGTSTRMYFLDRQGNRVSGYVNSDCVFVEVIDPDQDEDQYRRERVDGYWDGGQNIPFGPVHVNDWVCGPVGTQTHPVNALLGDLNIFEDNPATSWGLVAGDGKHVGWAKLYVLNPRNGQWAAIDILETGVATGDFVSVICIDLVAVYECVPTLGVLPGDTVIAAYMDPSNHSDSSWISIKVGIGGGGTPPGQASSTSFTDAEGNVVTSYTDADSVYVKVIDPSHAGAASLADAVEIGTATFDLAPLSGAATDTFITAAITMTELGVGAGDSITAAYTDPTDPTDTSSDTISIIASELSVEEFIAKPNPFADETVFTYVGSGIATTFSVMVYDLSGHLVWSEELANVTEVAWDGTNEAGAALANGAYIYVVMATDGTNTFTGKGKVFINR
jgi:hypothetical protein